MVAAGDGIIGEHHVIKWPIAKILIIPRDEAWNLDGNKSTQQTYQNTSQKQKTKQQNDNKAGVSIDERGEILVRYQHTPSVGCTRSLLVYTQPRTRGMCTVLDFWPTYNIDGSEDEMSQSNVKNISGSSIPDLAWFEPL